MTYGPPPNQNWRPPPPGYGPPPAGPGPYGPPRKPPLPGNLVTLGILGILLGIACFLGNIFSLVPMLVAVVGGIMVFVRQRAGAVLLAIASGLVLLLTLLGVLHHVAGLLPFNVGYRINLELEDDWLDLLRLLLAIAVFVLSLLPQTTQALTRPGPPGPPPGYGPPPPGYQQRPPTWR